MTKKAKKKQYPVKMDFPIWDRLKAKAEDDKRSVNATLLVLIDKYLES